MPVANKGSWVNLARPRGHAALLACFLCAMFLGAHTAATDFYTACLDAQGAVALVQAACARDQACHFEILDNTAIGGDSFPYLIKERTGLVDTPPLGDAAADTLNTYFVPDAWRQYGALIQVNAADPAAVDCAALALTLDTDPAPMPVQLGVARLVHYQNMVAQDGRCSDVNEMSYFLNGPGAPPDCMCLPDKVCTVLGEGRLVVLGTVMSILVLLIAAGTHVTVLARACGACGRPCSPSVAKENDENDDDDDTAALVAL